MSTGLGLFRIPVYRILGRQGHNCRFATRHVCESLAPVRPAAAPNGGGRWLGEQKALAALNAPSPSAALAGQPLASRPPYQQEDRAQGCSKLTVNNKEFQWGESHHIRWKMEMFIWFMWCMQICQCNYARRRRQQWEWSAWESWFPEFALVKMQRG